MKYAEITCGPGARHDVSQVNVRVQGSPVGQTAPLVGAPSTPTETPALVHSDFTPGVAVTVSVFVGASNDADTEPVHWTAEAGPPFVSKRRKRRDTGSVRAGGGAMMSGN